MSYTVDEVLSIITSSIETCHDVHEVCPSKDDRTTTLKLTVVMLIPLFTGVTNKVPNGYIALLHLIIVSLAKEISHLMTPIKEIF